MRTRWLTSDLHLGDEAVIRRCNRPYADAAEMDDDIAARWNAAVDPGDEVWVLGDLAVQHPGAALGRVAGLNGTLHLVLGNHDAGFGADEADTSVAERAYLEAGFASVRHGIVEIDLGLGEPVLASHLPYEPRPYEVIDGRDRYAGLRPLDTGRRAVHGHLYGRWRRNGRMVDVGLDAWGGWPVRFDTVARAFASRAAHLDPFPWRDSMRLAVA